MVCWHGQLLKFEAGSRSCNNVPTGNLPKGVMLAVVILAVVILAVVTRIPRAPDVQDNAIVHGEHVHSGSQLPKTPA
jgi:hypothetical protein